MGIPQLGFVTGLLYAVRRAWRARADPPDSLRCPITQELFRDPVVVTQTGYTYDRDAIERWLRQKTPPTDPSSNVELYATDIVPNWALRDATNEWCARNGARQLDAPECSGRKLAGGVNARDGKPPTTTSEGGGVGGGVLGSSVSVVSGLLGNLGQAWAVLTNGFARRAMFSLGLSPSIAAQVFAFSILALACITLSCFICFLEIALQFVGSSVFNSLSGGVDQARPPRAGSSETFLSLPARVSLRPLPLASLLIPTRTPRRLATQTDAPVNSAPTFVASRGSSTLSTPRSRAPRTRWRFGLGCSRSCGSRRAACLATSTSASARADCVSARF